MGKYTLVDQHIWRGPRPEPSDFADIKNSFATVISLEGLDEDIKEQSELAPVRVMSFPITPWEIYSPVWGLKMSRLYSILWSMDAVGVEKPLLVHCQHGQDRTGLVIAAWRVRHGWTKEQAQAEMRAFGFRYWLNYGLNRVWKVFV